MSAIRFLTALAKSVHSKLFSDDSTLKQVQPVLHSLASVGGLSCSKAAPTRAADPALWLFFRLLQYPSGTNILLLGMSVMKL